MGWDGRGRRDPLACNGHWNQLFLRGLTLGTNYYVAVSAVDTTGNESPLTTVASATTVQSSPSAPQGVAARFGADGTNVLMWGLSEDDGYNDRDVVRYDVLRAILPGGSYVKVGSVPAGIGLFAQTNLTVQSAQYVSYAVAAVDASGLSSTNAPAIRLFAGGGGVDTDGDGMPDDWESRYGLSPINPSDNSGDLDHDGLSNLQEYLAGSDPTIPRPAILAQPLDRALREGSATVFGVGVTSAAPFTCQWVFKGNPLTNGGRWSGVTTTNMSISNLQVADTGSYSALLASLGGAATSRVTSLVVTSSTPPLITSPPLSITTNLGATASFVVTASGTPPLHYQWRRDGSSITNGGRTSGATGTALAISNLQWVDAGSYTVVVTNDAGATTSTPPAILTLRDTSPPRLTITSHTNSQEVATNVITLAGTASDADTGGSGIASVTVNGAGATNGTASGSGVANWSQSVNLANGTNLFTIIASDEPGSSTTNLLLLISDTNRPNISITAPLANQRWSNSVFTVKGTASDDRRIALVWCQTNGIWGLANLGLGGTNWTLDLALMPGTNVVKAYAMDAAGNKSITNSVSFLYEVGGVLTLVVNPPIGGTVSGVTNNQWLELGTVHTATAKSNGTGGFVFTSWAQTTNGRAWATSNVPALTFTMQSNLELMAIFTDVRKPTNSIVAPTAGQRWSNAVFTVKGTAKDNWGVAKVCCQTNGIWGEARGTNAWTNWWVDVALVPGTNVVRAYAVDLGGNKSTTNSVSFVYVLSDRLQLRVVGQGTITPGYTNAVLEIGKRYTMAAKGVNGYVFGNWVVSTNWVGGVINTNATLSLIMQSNLTVLAIFVDVTKPTLTITAPKPSQRWSNAVFTVAGTLKDNARVAGVYCQNNGIWGSAHVGSGGTNWSVDMALVPGTNTVKACAWDAAWNWSATQSVTFVYVVSDRLQVRAVGQGTLTPSYSNAVLEIGKSYSMKASGVNGHVFTNWVVSTNWVDGVTNNKATLSFIMQSNLALQATFVDVSKPTLTITSPTANQRWSNAVFTVRGTAKDNAGVAGLWCQTNGVWGAARSTNSWTNWWMDVALTPGTNVVKAYAMDAAGNHSTTNTVSMVYVVSDRLQVRAVGQGTLTPNYSNAVLEIGKSYSMKASGVNGHVFTNWAVSTNWVGGTASTNATLSFTMWSNLTVQASFVDVAKPTLTITAPKPNQRWSNSWFTVTGTAKDNLKVSYVSCQVIGGAPYLVQTTNGWTNWTASVRLTPRTNVISAYAVDTAGNKSTTNLNVIYVVTNRLQVAANGLGTISPNYSNAWLEIGLAYGMTATPKSGFVLTNWTTATNWLGGVKTNSATVKFMMASNLTLQVNFVDVTKPTLAISSPASGQHMTNGLATIKGTASDNWKIGSVWYQINNGAWSEPTSTNGWTNWTTTVELAAGTNTIKAYAVDTGRESIGHQELDRGFKQHVQLKAWLQRCASIGEQGLELHR